MNLGKVPEPNELLDIALRRGRKESSTIGKHNSRLKHEKEKEKRRIEVAANYVVKRLELSVSEFPNIDQMTDFYRELLLITIDTDSVKKAIARMQAVAKIIKKLKREHLIRINKMGRGSEGKAKPESSRFIGRLSSLVKSLKNSIGDYNRAVVKLRELPHIKTNLPSVIIAGHPNVGKSTLLGKITKSQPKVASYAFTTQKLEIGYFKQKYSEYQLIDTPGLLDRPQSRRNLIEKKGTAALKHLASLIVFVFDPTENCGFTRADQARLLSGIAREFGKRKVIIYLSKLDISSKEAEDNARKRAKGYPVLNAPIEEMREKISKRIPPKVPLN